VSESIMSRTLVALSLKDSAIAIAAYAIFRRSKEDRSDVETTSMERCSPSGPQGYSPGDFPNAIVARDKSSVVGDAE
jgi:hypothetical protein